MYQGISTLTNNNVPISEPYVTLISQNVAETYQGTNSLTNNIVLLSEPTRDSSQPK
jgi:hypothetical protein